MFTPLGSRRTGPKPPRSPALLLFLVAMMGLATLLLVRDLKHPLIPRDLHSRPTPSDGPVEVIFLSEDGGTEEDAGSEAAASTTALPSSP